MENLHDEHVKGWRNHIRDLQEREMANALRGLSATDPDASPEQRLRAVCLSIIAMANASG